MDEHPDEPSADTSEHPDPPRPVRGVGCMVAPTVIGAAVGAFWSAYYAAVKRLDPATPIYVGAGIGLAVGAFFWAFFPYKRRPRRRPNPPEEDRS